MTSGFGQDLTGLTDKEAAARLAKAGPNRITAPRRVSFLGIAREEITEPMILLLLVVGFFYSLWGRIDDAITILIVIILLELFMDLAASAGFVAEPAERSIYEPDGNRHLFDEGMLLSIALSGLSLYAAVFGSFTLVLGQGMPLVQAQTAAFSSWMIGHIFLAFVSRSSHEPLLSLGPFTNRVMDLWALAAFAFLAVALAVPAVGARIRVAPLPLSDFLVIVLICFAAIFWQEVVKIMRFRAGHPVQEIRKAGEAEGS